MDVVEISSTAHQHGGVYKIKPLGVYAMIDDGELDWKVGYKTSVHVHVVNRFCGHVCRSCVGRVAGLSQREHSSAA